MSAQDHEPLGAGASPPPGFGSSASWQGLFLSGDGWMAARIAVSGLSDDQHAEARVEIECDPGSEAGIHTREPGQQEPGLGLVLRATGSGAVNVLGDLFRAIAQKLDGVLALAAEPCTGGRQDGEPSPLTDPEDVDLEQIKAMLAAGMAASEADQ